jgi:hypothetical protein
LHFICRDSCKYNQKRKKTGTLPCACTRQMNQMSSAVCLLTAKETRVDRLCCWAGDLATGWSLCRAVIQGTRHTARLWAHGRELTHGKLSTRHRRQRPHGDRRHTAKSPGSRQTGCARHTAHASIVGRWHTANFGTRRTTSRLTAYTSRMADYSWGPRFVSGCHRRPFVTLLHRGLAASTRRKLRCGFFYLRTA